MHIFSINEHVGKKDVEGGRLTHVGLISMLQKARLGFLAQHSMTEDCIIPGIGFVIGELNVRYVSAARENDKLKISLSIKNVGEKKCTITYDVRTDEAQSKIIGFAKTE